MTVRKRTGGIATRRERAPLPDHVEIRDTSGRAVLGACRSLPRELRRGQAIGVASSPLGDEVDDAVGLRGRHTTGWPTGAVHPDLSGIGFEASALELRISLVHDLAEDTLSRAGIERGMRVLDLDCGVGNAAQSIAKLVGPSGLLVGIDRSPEAIVEAERRATVAGNCYWVRFLTADPCTFVSPERFDVVVVRPTYLRRTRPAALSGLRACIRLDGTILIVSNMSQERP